MTEKKSGRGRGRPRKNTVKKPEKKSLPKKKEEDEIILRLKTFSSDESESESSGDESEENGYFTLGDTTEMGHKAINNITQSDHSEGSDSSVKSMKLEDVYRELKNKERLVKQLTDKLNYVNMYGTFSSNTATKSVIKKIHDLKLLDVNDRKTIKIPDKTNIKCWHCTHNFDGPPFFIPDSYINGYYYVFGCFCSFNCAASYNLRILNDARSKTRHSLILRLFHSIFGARKTLTYAPRKEMLKDYGGEMTIKEYRDTFMSLGKDYKMPLPPMLPLVYQVEVRTTDNPETTIVSAS